MTQQTVNGCTAQGNLYVMLELNSETNQQQIDTAGAAFFSSGKVRLMRQGGTDQRGFSRDLTWQRPKSMQGVFSCADILASARRGGYGWNFVITSLDRAVSQQKQILSNAGRSPASHPPAVARVKSSADSPSNANTTDAKLGQILFRHGSPGPDCAVAVLHRIQSRPVAGPPTGLYRRFRALHNHSKRVSDKIGKAPENLL